MRFFTAVTTHGGYVALNPSLISGFEALSNGAVRLYLGDFRGDNFLDIRQVGWGVPSKSQDLGLLIGMKVVSLPLHLFPTLLLANDRQMAGK